MAGGLFTCLKNTDLIKAREKSSYASFSEMQHILVDQMNEDFGAQVYDIAWREGSKYISVICRSKGCPYQIWFDYEMDTVTGYPTKIKECRKTNQSHHLVKHQVCDERGKQIWTESKSKRT